VLAPTYTNEGNAIVPIGIAALALVLYAVFHPVARQARSDRLRPDAEVDEDVALVELVDEGEVDLVLLPGEPYATPGARPGPRIYDQESDEQRADLG
jgi:hypothetical protein